MTLTLAQALHQAQATLASAHVDDALLISELLLRHLLKISRVQLYVKYDSILPPEHEAAFQRLIERARSGEPVAYITGQREFYGLDFYVDPRVLIPRPETELLVEKTISLAGGRPSTIADVGTGSGAIAISLAINLPQARIYATDISAEALEVARSNCQRHGVTDRICLLKGDMLGPLPEPVDFIVANLPYVREADTRSPPLYHEPRLALDAGKEGLACIERLCQVAAGKLRSGGHLLMEIGQGQARAVKTLAGRHLPQAYLEITPDLHGIPRLVDLALPSHG